VKKRTAEKGTDLFSADARENGDGFIFGTEKGEDLFSACDQK
jgi:hypothetical protein